MNEHKLFNAEYLPEALEQLAELSVENRMKIVEAIATFEDVGTAYKNINDLGDGLFEIKPQGVQAYFMYDYNRRRVIIIGFIVLKKTKEAPQRYMKKARKLLNAYLENERKELQNAKVKNN